MKLVEQRTGLKLDPKVKLLEGYRDEDRVKVALTDFEQATDDETRFSIVYGLASRPMKNVLDVNGIDDFSKFCGLSEETFRGFAAVGKTKIFELSLLRALFCPGVIAPRQDSCSTTDDVATTDSVELPHADDLIPYARVARLSARTRRVLGMLAVPMTPRGVCGLSDVRVLAVRGAGALVWQEIAALQGECLDETIWAEVGPQPAEFSTLADFVRDVVSRQIDLTETREVVLRDYMAVLDSPKKLTLEEAGQKVGLTRERVRQIAKKIVERAFSSGESGAFASLVSLMRKAFEENGWVLAKDQMVQTVESAYGWSGTNVLSLYELLSNLGTEIEDLGGGLYAFEFDRHLKEPYDAFVVYVNSYSGGLRGLDLDAMQASPEGASLANVSDRIYEAFVRRGTNYRVVKHKKGKKTVSITFESDVTALRPRQYFAYKFGTRVRYTGDGYNQGTIRRDAVIQVLKDAGPGGLEPDEMLKRAKVLRPNLDWAEGGVRSMIANLGQDLDDVGTRMIGYERGNATGERTSYSLNTFFRGEAFTTVFEAAGMDLRNYIETTGFGIVSVWKVWRKYKDKLPIPMPKLGFYMMLRDIGAAGLSYPDYPRVVHPDVECCPSAYNWELYQYFMLAQHPTASYQQIFDFFVECLCMDPVIANACAIPALGLKGDEDLVEGMFRIPEPLYAGDGYPQVFLANCQPDPSLPFSQPRRRGLHMTSADFDEQGRARTVLAYVRMFFFNLQESRYTFSSEEFEELTDPGWCAEHLGIHNAVVVPLSVSPHPPTKSYWIEPFDFGDVPAWVSNSWNAKRKVLFDVWAESVARRAGMDFEPYEL